MSVHVSQSTPAASIGTLHVADADGMFFAAIEAPMCKQVNTLRRLLLAAAGQMPMEHKNLGFWPSALASTITADLLKHASALGQFPTWVFFAAVAMQDDEVYVCTAGDIRVHLLQAGNLVRSTKDHILANESPGWVFETYGEIDLDIHGTMATRSLGNTRLPPESDTWRIDGSYTVAVCSSQYHGHRPVEAYVGELGGEGAVLADVADSHGDRGLWVRLDWLSEELAAGASVATSHERQSTAGRSRN